MHHLLNHIYTINQSDTHEISVSWMNMLNEVSKEKGRVKCNFLEIYDEPEEVAKYYEHNGKRGSCFPFNFQFLRFFQEPTLRYKMYNYTFTPQNIKFFIDRWLNNIPSNAWPNWLISNHDMIRVATRIGRENVDLANTLVMLLPGTVITYYGDEIGMEDLPIESINFNQTLDIFGKNFGPKLYWRFSRDYQRSLMQWNSSEKTSGGFTKKSVRPWLPIHQNHKTVNVAAQLNDSKSHLSVYKELVKFRQLPQFKEEFFKYAIVDDQVFSFIRKQSKNAQSLVILNLTNEIVKRDFSLIRGFDKKSLVAFECCKNDVKKRDQIDTLNIGIGPKSFIILHKIST